MKSNYTAAQNPTSWNLEDGTYLTPATATPHQVISSIHAHAIGTGAKFPVLLKIQPAEKEAIMITLNRDMTTQPAEIPTSSKSLKLYITAATITGLALVGTVLLLSFGKEPTAGVSASAVTTAIPTSTEEAALYTVPANEEILTLAGDTLYTTDSTGLKAIKLPAGTAKNHSINLNATKARTITAGTVTAIDGGEGQVILADEAEDEVRIVEGFLNARGTAPVILNGSRYITATDEGQIPENASVLGATEKNVLIVKAPSVLEYSGDGRSITIEPPAENARITSWVSGSDTRAVATWQEGENHWLTLTNTEDGKNLLIHPIPDAEHVKFSKGNILIGEGQALIGDSIQEICPTGKWVGKERWCKGSEGTWTYQEAILDTEPQATTDKYLITNNTIKER